MKTTIRTRLLPVALLLGVVGAFLILTGVAGASADSRNVVKKAGKTVSAWPMFHGTAAHTGYADVVGPKKATIKWKFKAGSGAENAPPPTSVAISADGTVYLSAPEAVYALTARGKEKWSKSYAQAQGPALSLDGKVLYFSSSKSLVAVSASTGDKKWSYDTGGEVHFGPTIDSDGTVYLGSWDKYFYAVKPDGSLKRKYETSGAVSYPASIDAKGVIYLGGGDAHQGPDSNVYAFSKDGKLLWKYDTKSTRVGSPAIGPDGLIYVPAAPTLIVLKRNGKLAWQKGPNVSASADCGSPPLPPCKGETGENPVNTNSTTNTNSGGSMTNTNNSAGSNTNSGGGASSGSKGDVAGIVTPAIGKNGTIYIGNSQGELLAINPKTQKTLWTYKSGVDPSDAKNYGWPSFPVVDKKSTTYIGSVDHYFYAVNKKGKLLWKYKTGGKIAEAAPALGPDGTLYFTSDDGYLYAVGK